MSITSLTSVFRCAGLNIEFTRLVAGAGQHQYVLVLRSAELGAACYYKSSINRRVSVFDAQEMSLLSMMGHLSRYAGITRLITHHMSPAYLDCINTFCDGYRRFLVGSETRKVVSHMINTERALAVNDDNYLGQAVG